MRDYAELAKALRICGNRDSDCEGCPLRGKYGFNDCAFAVDVNAADAIEELVAVCREIAAFVIHYADDDEVSAEVLCRKLNKIGLIEKDGAWWALPAPPKEVRDA